MKILKLRIKLRKFLIRNIEAFKNEIYEKINTGLKQIEEGKYVSAKQAFKELEEKYEL